MCAHVEQSGPMSDGNMNTAMVEHEVHDATEAVYDQSALLFRERPMIFANDELCVRVDTNERITSPSGPTEREVRAQQQQLIAVSNDTTVTALVTTQQ